MSFVAEKADVGEITHVGAYLLGAETIYSPLMDHLFLFLLLFDLRLAPSSTP